MRVGVVVQRYGPGVAGGAEQLARDVSSRLAAGGDEVTVLTTTARDYVTWANAFPPGEAEEDGVRLRRFPVARERDPEAFGALSEALFAAPGAGSLDQELAWVRSQGPDCPALLAELARLARTGDRHDAYLLFTYLYAPTLFAAAELGTRAVLVPLAHNEAPVYLRVYRNLFRQPASMLFQTPEEKALVERVVPRNPVPGEVVGVGIDPPGPRRPPRPELVPGDGPYVLYLGRLDPSKGVPELLVAHRRYREGGGRMPLVLAGRASMELPSQDGVVAPGWVEDEVRAGLLAHARALIQPSRFESLSLVALEAWSHGTPVVANRTCDVLAGQVGRSGGGWLYEGEGELADRLAALDRGPDEAVALGEAGRAWAGAECSWDRVLDAYRGALAAAASSAR